MAVTVAEINVFMDSIRVDIKIVKEHKRIDRKSVIIKIVSIVDLTLHPKGAQKNETKILKRTPQIF